MNLALVLVLFSSVLAAAGQVFLKLGASGATSLLEFVNVRVVSGLALYAASTLLWVAALARLPLSKVYPFTILTFVLVYVASAAVLGETISVTALAGALLVLAGLVVITLA
jgi:drug/metabolite transporter (DMT)-like permease